MPLHHRQLQTLLKTYGQEFNRDSLPSKLQPKSQPKPARLPQQKRLNAQSVASSWDALEANSPASSQERELLAPPAALNQIEAYAQNIENCLGLTQIPLGIAGPLRVNGLFAQGDYHLPLATTEAALVASYHRGAQLISEAGGCSTLLVNEGISRSPGFVFQNLIELSQFVLWLQEEFPRFQEIVERTSRHAKLTDTRSTVEGNHLYVNFDYCTGDAAGQNMATIATAAILRHIQDHAPIQPRRQFIEANLSGDKKASALSFLSVRGKKVTTEVTLPAELVKKRLRTTPETLSDYWQLAALGGSLSATMGIQGHYGNGLAALYLATGQDVACVAESSIGITRLEVTPEGALYASVTLPNIVVGTVGGGTKLPTQAAALRILGLEGEGKSKAFAEVAAACCLAGELSIMGAICADEFASSHQRLARKKSKA